MQTNTQKRQQQIIAFRGLNYGEGAVDGEFSETENLSTARFPCLSQRAGRATEGHYANGTNLFCDAQGKLLVIDGITVYYDGRIVGTVTPGDKQIASIGTKIVIYPDAVYYERAEDSASFRDLGKLRFPRYGIQFSGAKITMLSGVTSDENPSWGIGVDRVVETGKLTEPGNTAITIYSTIGVNEESGLITKSGASQTTFSGLKAGDRTDYQCEEGSLFADGGQYREIDSVRQLDGGLYEVSYTMHQAFWYSYETWDKYFSVGDSVYIAGSGNSGTRKITAIDQFTMTVEGADFEHQGAQDGEVTIGWQYPNFACVCESDNRIWGAEGNTIYASALGDPEHFFAYKGVSTDGYAVAVGTDGAFTACCPYSGSVLFWKEDRLHKVLGSYPAQYEVYTYQIPGVQKGCEKSLTNIGEVLYYQGKNGIYAFTGGTPELISEKFGLRRFHSGRAGTDGERYYISMQDEAGAWGLYTFDPMRGLWLREDGTHAAEFTRVDGELRFLTAGGGIVATGQDGSQEGPIPWSATLCRMDETSHGRKGYSKLYLRADLSAGAFLKVEISTDGGPFRQVFRTHNQRARTMVVPILPQRCDNFRIRLSGTGGCIVRSLVREFSLGSEY
jgi:hypothetical protein